MAGRYSPRELARLTGALYLYIMVSAMFAQALVMGRLIVSGDHAATVHNIAASEQLWRWGLAAEISTTVCDVAVAVLLYLLLRPVNRSASLVAGAFRLAFSAAMVVGSAFLAAPLLLLGDAPGRSAAELAAIQPLVIYSIRLHAAAFDIALVFFGVHLVLMGGLIARSTFLPRPIGAMLGVAGVCYIANSFIGFLAPAFADHLFPWILLPGFLAEAALTLWLLIAGVNADRWVAAEKRAAAA